MAQPITAPGVTFAVHDVEPATKLLPTKKTHESLADLLGKPVESCCDYTTDCVEGIKIHPLFSAVHLAFSQHRPLVLSPDMIWITILQGLSQHIQNHAEQLRDRLVQHSGKRTIEVRRGDILPGSPENSWDDVIGEFSFLVREQLGIRYDELIADFSTTGPLERTVCEVVLLDAFKPYFEYVLVCVCGIPSITLEGTGHDWQRLREKVETLALYDLDWWLPSVRLILDHFVRASQGDVDLEHWQNIYKRFNAYGGDVINGWIINLVPYLRAGPAGNFTLRNPLLSSPDEKISSGSLPGGLSHVPFRLMRPLRETAMEFLGGFIGVTQDRTTLGLRPKLGWAVGQGSSFDQLLNRIAKHGFAPPLDNAAIDALMHGLLRPRQSNFYVSCSGELLQFYKSFNGGDLFQKRGIPTYHFRPLEQVDVIRSLTLGTSRSGDLPGQPTASLCARFCDLPDNSFIAIECCQTDDFGWRVIRGNIPRLWGKGNRIVATSFSDFLTKALDSQGNLNWLDEEAY